MEKYSFTKEYSGKRLKCNYILTEEQTLEDGKVCCSGKEFSAPFFRTIDAENIKALVFYIITVEELLSEMTDAEKVLSDFNSTRILQDGEDMLREKIKKITDLHISGAMGPGYFGMNLEEGRKIYEIACGKSLGVTINASGVFEPATTNAGFFFLSEKPVVLERACRTCMGNKGGCSMCSLKCSRKEDNSFFNEKYEEGNTESNYGLTCDMGTTNIVCRLYDLATGKFAGTCSLANPESIYGRDVITRQTFALKGEAEKEMLHSLLVKGINRCIERIAGESRINRENISRVVAGGNTTISHFLLNLSVDGISKSPFVPEFTEGRKLKASETGIRAGKDAELYVPGNLGGHVGSDITAGLLNHEISHEEELCIYIDIGTNGEIVLKDNGKYYATSVAAGPVFEGGYLSCGMRAGSGAVTEVSIGREVSFRTIGDREPEGICGSGIVSVVAAMLKSGLIDRNGNFMERDYMARRYASKDILDRIDDKERTFSLTGRVYITQDDIRKFQVAKAAIRAGIITLLKERGKEESDIKKIYITGAFGRGVKEKDLVSTGIVPDVPLTYIEESASEGLAYVLLNEHGQMQAENIRKLTVSMFLNDAESFQETYVKEMSF